MIVVHGDGNDSVDESLEALSRYNLYISLEETRVIVAVAREALEQSERVQAAIDAEIASTPDAVSDTQRRKRQAQVARPILAGRDRLASRLRPQSFRALTRWIAKSITPGMLVYLDPTT